MKNIKSGTTQRFRWKLLLFPFLLLFSLTPLTARPFRPGGTLEVQQAGNPDLERMISVGTAQVEIIKILIKQGKYDQVLPEMKVILGLDLPDKYEELKGQSAAVAAILLSEQKQWDYAHEVLDETLSRMKLDVNKSYVLLFKAKVYNAEGKTDKALETYQLAVSLSKQP